MLNSDNKTILIFGGAGFIGSNIAQRFCDEGYMVTVVDGFLPETGGCKRNLKGIISNINLIESRIEDVDNLPEVVRGNDLIVDCMAWTSHHSAIDEPLYDLKLNAESHLYLLKCLKGCTGKHIIYLSSRGVYGNPQVDEITEETAMMPEDIQGIHKLTAESYYRVYSRIYGFNVISLRLSNCFGANQPVEGRDIGLLGGFVRDILSNRDIEIFGRKRRRFLVYVKDLSDAVFKLSERQFRGFEPFNIGGIETYIEELAELLIGITGQGSYSIKEMPLEVKNMDIGNAAFSEAKLRVFLGGIQNTDLKIALSSTVSYFKENM